MTELIKSDWTITNDPGMVAVDHTVPPEGGLGTKKLFIPIGDGSSFPAIMEATEAGQVNEGTLTIWNFSNPPTESTQISFSAKDYLFGRSYFPTFDIDLLQFTAPADPAGSGILYHNKKIGTWVKERIFFGPYLTGTRMTWQFLDGSIWRNIFDLFDDRPAIGQVYKNQPKEIILYFGVGAPAVSHDIEIDDFRVDDSPPSETWGLYENNGFEDANWLRGIIEYDFGGEGNWSRNIVANPRPGSSGSNALRVDNNGNPVALQLINGTSRLHSVRKTTKIWFNIITQGDVGAFRIDMFDKSGMASGENGYKIGLQINTDNTINMSIFRIQNGDSGTFLTALQTSSLLWAVGTYFEATLTVTDNGVDPVITVTLDDGTNSETLGPFTDSAHPDKAKHLIQPRFSAFQFFTGLSKQWVIDIDDLSVTNL